MKKNKKVEEMEKECKEEREWNGEAGNYANSGRQSLSSG